MGLPPSVFITTYCKIIFLIREILVMSFFKYLDEKIYFIYLSYSTYTKLSLIKKTPMN